MCDKWAGAIFITEDGVVHASASITAEQAAAEAKKLPNDHNTLAMAPCIAEHGKEQET